MNTFILNTLKIKKATESDWKVILEVLNESKMDFWFTGGENYKIFYTITDNNLKEIIGCFAFDLHEKTGILRSFVLKKNLRGKGIGKHIADLFIPKLAKELNLQQLFLLADIQEPYVSCPFWEKTIFKKIDINNVKDKFFKDYLDLDEIKFPGFVETRVPFYLEIT